MILSNIHKHYKTTLWKKCQFLSLYFQLLLHLCFFFVVPFQSDGIWLFFFFCCNQTHRFISVILRHDLNQFPSTLTSWRVAVRDGTLQLRHTYIDTPTQTLSISFTFTHTVVKVQRRVPIYPHTRHTHTHTGDSPHHCSLMSYLLHLCNFHLSLLTGPGSNIYPSYLYPYSVSPHCFSPP